jgi:elongation factor Ts
MSDISAASVMKLRQKTGAPMMECKAALTEAKGEMEKAVEILRKKNAAIREKKGERETAEGRIAVYIDSAKKVGSIVEFRCESAPVVKSEAFVKLADDIAKQIALKGITAVDALVNQPFIDDPKKTINDRIGEVVGLIRENMKVARAARLTGLLGSYVHHNDRVGVLLEVEGAEADPQMLKEVGMHIVAKNPVAARREDVPADVIAKEKEIAKSQVPSGKPANIADKIAEGKMKTWFAENVLAEQPFVRDESKTVGDLLKSAGLKLVKFIRYSVGEIN